MFLKIMGAMPGYIYAHDATGICVNLFVGSRAIVELASGKVTVKQTTRYPWEGDVQFEIFGRKPGEFDLDVRIPGWRQRTNSDGELYQVVGRPATVLCG